jgi:hypothetical protein
MCFLYVLVFLAALPQPKAEPQSPSHGVKQTDQASRNEQKRDHAPQITQLPTAPVASGVNEPAPSVEKQDSKPKANSWCDAFAPSTWSNWGLLIIGFGGVIVAVRTLSTFVAQTDATRVAADAALLNAKAAINSERAYITVGSHIVSSGFYNFRGVNEGRTPAEIFSIFSDFLTPANETEIPQLLNYGTDTFADPKVLATNNDIEIREWAIGPEVKMQEGKLLVYYGRIGYRDILGNPHETKFCFRYDAVQYKLVRCGPKGCNQHT